MYRIGQSSDIHAFCEGNTITLGGEVIPYVKGITAHSDGDALCHAIGEAILGALALGDLGHHFPDTEERYRNVSSIYLLTLIYQKMIAEGYVINNIDSLILIEKPKMAPYVEQMRKNIAQALKIDINQVSVKATRGEKIGFVGREEGVLCQCVVLLKRREENE